MSAHVFEVIWNAAVLVAFVAAVGFFAYQSLARSRAPWVLVWRWLLTATALYLLAKGGRAAGEAFTRGDASAVFAVFEGAIGGLFLAVIWTPVMTAYFGGLLGGIIDGGDEEIEGRPYYSAFHAKRGKGLFFEALAEVRRQLDKYPTDCEGQMLLASLQAENLDDLPGAEVTIQRLCNQPGHAPANIADALNQLADWHLQIGKDRDSARRALERVGELLPDSEMAMVAAQRIARLAQTDALLAPNQRTAKVMAKGVENLGLMQNQDHLKQVETDPGVAAADYVKHLAEHPLDTHAREKLALLYARHYHRLDLALDQLEQLVQEPNFAAKQVIHWLNMMADLQVHEGADPAQVRVTLQRIVDLYPDLAAAETARRRMDTLKLEMRVNHEPQPVKLGAYEQNIGLKGTKIPEAERPSYSPIK
jgi:tetratricopeptide (TPR) repeat protein